MWERQLSFALNALPYASLAGVLTRGNIYIFIYGEIDYLKRLSKSERERRETRIEKAEEQKEETDCWRCVGSGAEYSVLENTRQWFRKWRWRWHLLRLVCRPFESQSSQLLLQRAPQGEFHSSVPLSPACLWRAGRRLKMEWAWASLVCHLLPRLDVRSASQLPSWRPTRYVRRRRDISNAKVSSLEFSFYLACLDIWTESGVWQVRSLQRGRGELICHQCHYLWLFLWRVFASVMLFGFQRVM